MMRKFWIAIVLVVLCIGACGCMSDSTKDVAEGTRDKAQAYLESKYDDTFTVKAFAAGGWAYPYDSVTFTSQKYSGAIVEVRGYQDENGETVFVDNYYRLDMMQDAVAYCKGMFNSGAISVRVRFPNSVWSDKLAGAETFTQWRGHGTCEMDIFVITAEALSESEQMTFSEAIAEDEIYGLITFFTTDDKELLVDCTLDDILNNQGKLIQSQSRYYINFKFEIQKK